MAKVIYNDLIPFKGFQAITILPFIFARNSAKWLKDYVLNHETIHLRQQLEVLIASAAVIAALILIFGWSWWWMLTSFGVYYAWYGIEWLVRLAICHDTHLAYKNIAFEQEAYLNEYDMTYLKNRKLFAWVEYIGKQSFRK
jgi:hypothetical protein